MPDEVQDGQDRLVPGPAKPATELLQEERGAFSWSQQQDGVGIGKVESLVEEICCKENVDVPRAKFGQSLVSFGPRCRPTDRASWDARLVEDTGHVLRVSDADA